MRRFRIVRGKDSMQDNYMRWFAQEQRWGWRGYTWYRVPFEGTPHREDAPKALLLYLNNSHMPVYEFDPVDGHLLQVKKHGTITLLKTE